MTARPARTAEQAGRQVEEILDRLAATGDRAVCGAAEELVRALMDFYGAGLARVLALAGQTGPQALERLLGDELVAGMLVLHGLHPEPVEARIDRALLRLPVELVGFDAGSGLLRVRSTAEGGCGCPSTDAAARTSVEDALACFAAEVTAVELEPAAKGAPVLLQIAPRPSTVNAS
ncbi:hypothetical protein [Streptomyces sp. IBSBF 2435]|uniref:hypothetical protein n=1 Tax=Streptomyces sp. IBSBF 2435 TaxID=2903531 RepID=UPI002FDBAF5B